MVKGNLPAGDPKNDLRFDQIPAGFEGFPTIYLLTTYNYL
jgi:hypothetical protein